MTSIYVGAISLEAVRVISEPRRRTMTTTTATAAAECLQADSIAGAVVQQILTAVWAMCLYIVINHCDSPVLLL